MISLSCSKSKRGWPQKTIKSNANNSVIVKPKIQVRGVFQLEKMSGIKMSNGILKISNFGLGSFLDLLLLGSYSHQLKNLNIKILERALRPLLAPPEGLRDPGYPGSTPGGRPQESGGDSKAI